MKSRNIFRSITPRKSWHWIKFVMKVDVTKFRSLCNDATFTVASLESTPTLSQRFFRILTVRIDRK